MSLRIHEPSSGPSKPSPAERRQSVRYAPQPEMSTRLTALVGDDLTPAKIHNVSALGIAVQLTRRIEPGAVVSVEIQGAASGKAQKLQFRVTHVVEETDGSFIVGGAFTEKPNGFDLLTLLV